jgi:GTPase SAR1 family protein
MAARQKLPLYKVVLLGVCGVGKTALCARFCLDDFLDTVRRISKAIGVVQS